MHHNKLTPRRCVAIIVLTWILSIVIGMLPLMGWNIVGKSNENDSSDFGEPERLNQKLNRCVVEAA